MGGLSSVCGNELPICKVPRHCRDHPTLQVHLEFRCWRPGFPKTLLRVAVAQERMLQEAKGQASVWSFDLEITSLLLGRE